MLSISSTSFCENRMSNNENTMGDEHSMIANIRSRLTRALEGGNLGVHDSDVHPSEPTMFLDPHLSPFQVSREPSNPQRYQDQVCSFLPFFL